MAPIHVNLKSKILNLKNKENKEHGLNSKFIFLTVSRLAPVKNISLQIRAMAELIKKYPNTELWIVGDGAEKSNLKSKISKLKLENNVKLLGWQNNPDEFYSQADAFLLTSNYEGWGYGGG